MNYSYLNAKNLRALAGILDRLTEPTINRVDIEVNDGSTYFTAVARRDEDGKWTVKVVDE